MDCSISQDCVDDCESSNLEEEVSSTEKSEQFQPQIELSMPTIFPSTSSTVICFSDKTFFVDFASGFEFRQFVEFIRKISKELPLVISPFGLSTVVCSSTRRMVVNASFRRRDLTEFYFDESLSSDYAPKTDASSTIQQQSGNDIIPHTIVNIDIKNLQDAVKNIAKKDDGIFMYQLKSQPTNIQIKLAGSRSDGETTSVRLHKYTPVSCSVTELQNRSFLFPNATIQLKHFCACLAGLIKTKVSNAVLTIFNQGMLIQGQSSSGILSTGTKFGIVASQMAGSDEKYWKITLPLETVSSLSKLSNFQHNGVVRIYCFSDNLIRLECGIGCFGSVRIFIGNNTDTSLDIAS